jgi:diguanylate cyclase (GGDEF)-like protein
VHIMRTAFFIVAVILLGGIAPARAVAPPVALAAATADGPPAFELAVMETPRGTPLADIVSGRAQPGFTPLLTPGTAFAARPDRAIWLRLRTTLPPGPSERWRIDIVRVPLDRVRVRLPDGRVVAEDTFYGTDGAAQPWPSNFELPLPSGLAGATTLYLELEGNTNGGLHVRMKDAAGSARGEAAARIYFRTVYAVLLLVAFGSLGRRMIDPASGPVGMGTAAFFAWLACVAINGHLYSLPEVSRLSGLGATAPLALFMLGAGPLLLATVRYAGLAKSSPGLLPWVRGVGWLLSLAAVAALVFLPETEGPLMQRVGVAAWAVAVGLSAIVLLMDSRNTRWAPLASLLVMALLGGVRLLADRQFVPATLFNLYGWQLMLALTMVLYVSLPWLRSALQRWAIKRRREPPEPSAQEKIDQAREKLVATLQAGLRHAADGDMKWIAFRRLLDGLKQVLPQSSAAVVAMDFHGEDLLQVEPPEAEPRYRELLTQRSTLLRNLSRLRAPQQVGIDFDGSKGPLEQVQMALIPLPVPKPGWGALLVERPKDVAYSDAELALCAEFAAVAMLAGEEAAMFVKDKREADTDPLTGTLKAEAIRAGLAQSMDAARLARRPLCLLYVIVDQLPELRAAAAEGGAALALEPIGALLREEMDYGDLIGRSGDDGFLMVADGKRLLEARDYADRLRASVEKMPVDARIGPGFTISVGVAPAVPGERDPAALIERAQKAALIASKNGANQIFS